MREACSWWWWVSRRRFQLVHAIGSGFAGPSCPLQPAAAFDWERLRAGERTWMYCATATSRSASACCKDSRSAGALRAGRRGSCSFGSLSSLLVWVAGLSSCARKGRPASAMRPPQGQTNGPGRPGQTTLKPRSNCSQTAVKPRSKKPQGRAFPRAARGRRRSARSSPAAAGPRTLHPRRPGARGRRRGGRSRTNRPRPRLRARRGGGWRRVGGGVGGLRPCLREQRLGGRGAKSAAEQKVPGGRGGARGMAACARG